MKVTADRSIEQIDLGKQIAQGAEGCVYKTKYNDRLVAVKIRPSKKYRHPELDKMLRRQRARGELRSLERAKKNGIPCPEVILGDKQSTSLCLEWINGKTVKSVIDYLSKSCQYPDSAQTDQDKVIPACDDSDDEGDQLVDLTNAESEFNYKLLKPLAEKVAKLVAKLHNSGMTHGDITTSNILMKADSDFPLIKTVESAHQYLQNELVFIDFGLSSGNASIEDKAVDLYVLERAWISTHPTTASVLALRRGRATRPVLRSAWEMMTVQVLTGTTQGDAVAEVAPPAPLSLRVLLPHREDRRGAVG